MKTIISDLKKTLDKNTIFYISEFLVNQNIKQVNQINKDILKSYKKFLSNKYEVTDINKRIEAINSLLKHLLLDDLKLLKIKIQTNYREKNLTLKEITRIIEYTKQHKRFLDLYLMIEIVLRTGVRLSEINFFDKDSIKNRRVKIVNKNKYRVVIISNNLYKILSSFIGVFPIKLSRQNCHAKLKALAYPLRIKKEKLFMHNFRHYYAKMCIDKNIDLKTVQDFLGHSCIKTTALYLKNDLSKMSQIVNKHF
jgi:integrase